MRCVSCNGFLSNWEPMPVEQLTEPQKKASQLLEESATTFDEACMKVRAMEEALDNLRGKSDEALRAIEQLAEVLRSLRDE